MNTLLLFLFLPKIWIAIGVILVIIEIFDGNMLFLPSGLGALFTSFSLFIDGKDILTNNNILNHWGLILIYFLLSSIIFIFVLRKIFKSKYEKSDDINIY